MIPRIAAVILALFLTSCTLGIRFSLYNNTSEIIKASGCGQLLEIAPSTSELIMVCKNLVLEVSGKTRSYNDFTPPPEEHDELRIFLDSASRFIVFRSQINSDGSIYLVKKDADLPIIENTTQPDGFPIQGKLIDNMHLTGNRN